LVSAEQFKLGPDHECRDGPPPWWVPTANKAGCGLQVPFHPPGVTFGTVWTSAPPSHLREDYVGRFEMGDGGSLLIPEDVCWELLRGSSVGRVTLPVPGVPSILPVHYYVEEDEIVLCLGHYEVPLDVLDGDCIGLAVDEMDVESSGGWSVQVRAMAIAPGSLELPARCGGIQAGQLLRIRPESVVGYHMDLCPFASAFEDLVTRLECSDGFAASVSDCLGSFELIALAESVDEALEGFTLSHNATDVLVVDFQDALRETTADLLRHDGSSVLEAESAEEAAEILSHRDVRLMLLEPDLPIGSGVDLVEQLDGLPQVVIFSSTQVSPEDRARLEGRVVCYVQKPVAPASLIALVQDLLGRPNTA